MPKIYLSPPNVDEEEEQLLLQTVRSGWVAPSGPTLDLFEKHLEEHYEGKRVLAVNSGTAALHLALLLSGVGRGDSVVTATHTFAACPNSILYTGAKPVFIDSEQTSWNLDPDLFVRHLAGTSKPKALIVTHIYGMPAKMDQLVAICRTHGIVLIEDAAEAVGSRYGEALVGGVGDFGVLSFNGNKILSTGGGGALILDDVHYNRALHLATQANSGTFYYHHNEVGYNYRMSSVAAALGIAQLKKLDQFVEKKRAIQMRYEEKLGEHLTFLAEPDGVMLNRWLSVGLIRDPKVEVMELINYLDENGIESRRFWQPLHLQPAYRTYSFLGSDVAKGLYDCGICLPSGTGLSIEEQGYVIGCVLNFFKQ